VQRELAEEVGRGILVTVGEAALPYGEAFDGERYAVATPEEGARLVRALLERRLIACGSLLPGSRSLYRWEGKIADEQETVILMKTRSAVLHALEKAFAELHPYKVPELLALEVQWGLDRYVNWINDETSMALLS